MMTQEQARLLAATARRAEAVKKFAMVSLRSGHCIEPIMAGAAWNLIRTLLVLCGQSLQSQFFEWLTASLREQHGLCAFCGQVKEKFTDGMCQPCLKQCEAEDKDCEAYELMVRDVSGPVS